MYETSIATSALPELIYIWQFERTQLVVDFGVRLNKLDILQIFDEVHGIHIALVSPTCERASLSVRDQLRINENNACIGIKLKS